MKPTRNPLQSRVLKRLEAGLPLTRWQQFRLHVNTAWKHRCKLNRRRVWFHLKGVLRIFWKPITLLRLAGIPVQLHLTCFIYPFGLVALMDWEEQAGRTAILVLMLAVISSSGLLIHEFAHVLTARRMGIGTRRVVFIPFGAFAELESFPRARVELCIASAGPLASLALTGCFWLALGALEMFDTQWTYLPRLFCTLGFAINLMLALFNLLPCFPMDGGRIFRSLLAVIIGRAFPRRADRAFVIATQIAVRYVAWVVALGMIALTIMVTHLWLHLILFPLLLFVAEIEYWLVRTEKGESRDDAKCV